MTTIDLDSATYFAADRSPRLSFAARLAVLQARQEQAPRLAAMIGVAARFALAAVPVSALGWLFVFA